MQPCDLNFAVVFMAMVASKWMDHVSGWTKDGKPALLLAQPYSLFNIESLLKATSEFNLDVSVNGDGWYGHGTIAIELRRAQIPC